MVQKFHCAHGSGVLHASREDSPGSEGTGRGWGWQDLSGRHAGCCHSGLPSPACLLLLPFLPPFLLSPFCCPLSVVPFLLSLFCCPLSVVPFLLQALMRRAWTHGRAVKPVCAVLSLCAMSAVSRCWIRAACLPCIVASAMSVLLCSSWSTLLHLQTVCY